MAISSLVDKGRPNLSRSIVDWFFQWNFFHWIYLSNLFLFPKNLSSALLVYANNQPNPNQQIKWNFTTC